MSKDVLKGKWKELSGDVKRRWGKLTDDDMTEINGDAEMLRGKLQKRYGYSKDEAQDQYDQFVASWR